MDFIKELFGKIGGAVHAFGEALKSKNLGQMWQTLKDLVRAAVFYTEEISKGLKEVDVVLSGEDKHAMVLDALKDTVVKKINQLIDLPFIGEETEEKIFRGIINAMIRPVVDRFNKTGWKI